jgi:hypothetical protein
VSNCRHWLISICEFRLVFCALTACHFVDRYQHFGITCCHCLWSSLKNIWNTLSVTWYWRLLMCLKFNFSINMMVLQISEVGKTLILFTVMPWSFMCSQIPENYAVCIHWVPLSYFHITVVIFIFIFESFLVQILTRTATNQSKIPPSPLSVFLGKPKDSSIHILSSSLILQFRQWQHCSSSFVLQPPMGFHLLHQIMPGHSVHYRLCPVFHTHTHSHTLLHPK